VLADQGLELGESRCFPEGGEAEVPYLEDRDGHGHFRRELEASVGPLRVGSSGCEVEGVLLIRDHGGGSEEVVAESEEAKRRDLERFGQLTGVDGLDGVVDPAAVLEDELPVALGELVPHGVELAGAVALAPGLEVVFGGPGQKNPEDLGERAASHTRQQDQLAQPILGDLTAVLPRELEVRVGEEVREAVGRLSYRDRLGVGSCGEQEKGDSKPEQGTAAVHRRGSSSASSPSRSHAPRAPAYRSRATRGRRTRPSPPAG
jgi:hypothetical protein